LVTILGIAGMYLMLAAELLAAVQVVVYAGAVVVLFLFVIMLLGPSASETSDARGAISRYFGAFAFAFAGVGALWAIMRIGGETLTVLPPPPAGLGTIELIGRELFSKQIVPFQIAGVLLTIAVVGAMAIARGRGPGDPLAPKPEPCVTPAEAVPGASRTLAAESGAGAAAPGAYGSDSPHDVVSSVEATAAASVQAPARYGQPSCPRAWCLRSRRTRVGTRGFGARGDGAAMRPP
jgi:NADH-quinone oxidoreductase subunit J